MSIPLSEILAIAERASTALSPKPEPKPAAPWTMPSAEHVRATMFGTAPKATQPKPAAPAVSFEQVMNDRKRVEALPSAARGKLMRAINASLLEQMEARMAAQGCTHIEGEPARNWIAARLVTEVARIQAWESKTGKRVERLPAFHAAAQVIYVAEKTFARAGNAAMPSPDAAPAQQATPAQVAHRPQHAAIIKPRQTEADDVAQAARQAIALARQAGVFDDESEVAA